MVFGKISKFLAGAVISFNLAVSPVLAGTSSQLSSSSSIEPIEEKTSKDALLELEKTIDERVYNATYFIQADKLASASNIEEYIKNNIISEKDMYGELKKESIVMLADTHCFSRHRKKMIEIIKNINRENLAVGLETFGTDMQRHIDDYMHSRISLEKFVSMTRYSERELKKYGYVSLLEFLKESNIKTIGVDMPNFIVKSTIAEASIRVFINQYSGFDFFNRDLATTKAVIGRLNEGEDVAIVIGGIHAREDHLPYMIEEASSKKPAIVFQQPYPIRKSTSLAGEYERFKELGLGKGKALKVNGNYKEFYLNTEPDIKEMHEYMKENFISSQE